MRTPSSPGFAAYSGAVALLRLCSLPGLGLAASAAYAQGEGGASIPPSETVSVVFVVLFGVAFVAMIAGFFVYLWMNERKRKADGGSHES